MLLAIVGCTPRTLVERAIRARGGSLPASVTRFEAIVHVGAPGRWEWTRAFLAPERYAWRIVTAADPHYHLFDGSIVRSFIGTALVASDASPSAPLRSHARWTAVVNLDALRAPGVVIAAMSPAALPPGTVEGLVASLADGTCYELAFDRQTVLVWARGPLDLSPLGKEDITVRFADHRRVGGFLLPFLTSYTAGGVPVAEERARAICVDPALLGPEVFVDPVRFPSCP